MQSSSIMLRIGLRQASEILGVSTSATSKDVKSAFRTNALKWHPDKNPSPEAQKRFRECHEAMEVLTTGQGSSSSRNAGGRWSHADAGSWRPPWQWQEQQRQRSQHQHGQEHWNQQKQHWQQRAETEKEKKERQHERAAAARAEAAKVSAQARVAADRLGIKPGVLLVAAPQNRMHGIFTLSVTLLVEVDEDNARGVSINCVPGGREGGGEWTVFHSCPAEASADPKASALLGDFGIYVEEFLRVKDATELRARLENLDEPFVAVERHTWWRLENLVREIEHTHNWKVFTWGAEEAQWWLRTRSKLSSRLLWRRALETLRPPS